MTPHLQLLLELGFRKHGAWVATDTGIAYSLDVPFPPYDEALYAFVGGTQVLYVGKTGRHLKKRFQGYQNPPKTAKSGATTNINNKRLIAE